MESRSDGHIDERDPDAFAERVQSFHGGPLRVDATRARAFSGAARAWGLPRAALVQVDMRGGRVSSVARPRVLGFTFALEGLFKTGPECGREPFESGHCHFLRDDQPFDLIVPAVSVLALNIEADLVEKRARELADEEPPAQALRETHISLASPEGARLWRSVASVWRALRADRPGPREARATAALELELAEAVADWMLGAGTPRAHECAPHQLREAEEFILAHLGDPISRAEICAAAGVSERSLSRAFAGRYGTGPMSFLKQRRLDAAQRLLLAADPEEACVTDVAMECGLYHLGRFSVEYRKAFGESPSETLRR